MKKTIDKTLPKCYTIIVKREIGWRKGALRFQKKSKKPLDKPLKVWYNKGTKGEGKAVPQRERPTRVSKTYSRWTDRTVFLCAGYKCEPDHAGWKNVVDTQDTQAILFTHNGREFCPLPMNGVECRRINSRGLSPFFLCSSLFLMPADFLFHRRHQTFFEKNWKNAWQIQ